MTIRFVAGAEPTVPDCFIADRGPAAKPLIAIHGISRNAAEMATRFAADPRFDRFTICAPLFEKARFGQYQQLIAKRGTIASDLALLDLLQSLARNLGADTSAISLFGFSGGAQMAHRFAMLHPHRVAQVFAASAGWYLMPDADLAYPFGLADTQRFGPVSDAFLNIPITIAVGTRDTRVDRTVRQGERINTLQGRTRWARARKYVAAMQARAKAKGVPSRAQLIALEGGTHDFAQCVRESGLIVSVANAFDAKLSPTPSPQLPFPNHKDRSYA